MFAARFRTALARPTAILLAATALAAALAGTSCRRRYAPFEQDAVTCSNGLDDDLDGLTDCADLGCVLFCGGPTDGGPGTDAGAGFCGDSVCVALEGEDCGSCEPDCGACPPGCGDGTCAATEDCANCPMDCGGPCAGCPDGTCGAGETCTNCPADCGTCPPTCPNGTCGAGETCTSCPADCGTCTGGCGDGTCSLYETCSTCALDCAADYGTSFGTDSYYDLCVLATGASLCEDVIGGTAVAAADDTYTAVTLPFTFPLYGGAYTTVNITSNGRLNFGPPDTSYVNACLPNVNYDLYAIWDDLDGAAGGGIHYTTLGSAPNRIFAVEWNVPTLGSTNNYEVRAYLYESLAGTIRVCYVDSSSTLASGADATTGLQGGATDYLTYSCGGSTITAGTILYYLPL